MSASGFDWVREPVLNPYTRLAVAMSPARGILRAVGYDSRLGRSAAAGDARSARSNCFRKPRSAKLSAEHNNAR